MVDVKELSNRREALTQYFRCELEVASAASRGRGKPKGLSRFYILASCFD